MEMLRRAAAAVTVLARAVEHERKRGDKQEFVVKAEDIGMSPEGNRHTRRKQHALARRRKEFA